jgi:hypothetical protein
MQQLQRQCLSLQQQQQRALGGLAAGATAAAMGWTTGNQQQGPAGQAAVGRCCLVLLLVQAAMWEVPVHLLLVVVQPVARAVDRPGVIVECRWQQQLLLLVAQAGQAAGPLQVAVLLLALLLQAAAVGARAAAQMAALRQAWQRHRQQQLVLRPAGLAQQQVLGVRVLVLRRQAARAVRGCCWLHRGLGQLLLLQLAVCVRTCSRLMLTSR